MNKPTRLLFVYNADSGLFNTMADIGHKIFSPETYECALCALTHGYFKERTEWRSFIEGLEIECDFMHRDEFNRHYPDSASPLPAVFRIEGERPVLCLDKEAVEGSENLEHLQSLIRNQCCPIVDS